MIASILCSNYSKCSMSFAHTTKYEYSYIYMSLVKLQDQKLDRLRSADCVFLLFISNQAIWQIPSAAFWRFNSWLSGRIYSWLSGRIHPTVWQNLSGANWHNPSWPLFVALESNISYGLQNTLSCRSELTLESPNSQPNLSCPGERKKLENLLVICLIYIRKN
jgi:hypothetical protein